MSDEGRDEKPDTTLTISVKVPNGEPIKLKVKKDTKMNKIFGAIAQNLGVEIGVLRFMFDGHKLSGG
jgi:hypothetical protein